MSQDISLEEIVKRIVLQTGLSREDIMNRIDEAIKNVNGLLTKVGAALVLADKLKVKIELDQIDATTSPDDAPSLKIKDLVDGMRNIIVFGRVSRIFPVKTFPRQDGRKGKVSALMLKDDTGDVRVTLWDQKATLVENAISVGDVIGVYNGYTKINKFSNNVEINVSNRGTIKPATGDIDTNQFPEVQGDKPVNIADISESVSFCTVHGKVLQKFPKKSFERNGKTKYVAKINIADESGGISVVFWTDRMDDYERVEEGKTYQFNGLGVRKNNYNQKLELHVNRRTEIKNSTKKLNVKDTQISSSVSSDEVIHSFEKIPENAFSINVRGTIAFKGDVRNWKKGEREGSVANLNLIDNDQRSIRVVFWTDKIEDYEKLKVGDLIELQDVSAKPNRGKTELTVKRDSIIEKLGSEEVKVELKNIGDIIENQSLVAFKGRIKSMDEVKTITLKSGDQARLVNFVVGDESGLINVVAWRENVDKIINTYKEGDPIQIQNVNTRFNQYVNMIEASISSVTKISKPGADAVPDLKDLPEVKQQRGFSSSASPSSLPRVNLDEIEDNMKAEVYGRITSVSKFVNHYMACPECMKKVQEGSNGFTCPNHGPIKKPDMRLIAKITVDDGTNNMGITLIGDTVLELFGIDEMDKDLIIDNDANQDMIDEIKSRIVSRPFLFRGNIKFNDYREEYEMIPNQIIKPDFSSETSRVLKHLEINS